MTFLSTPLGVAPLPTHTGHLLTPCLLFCLSAPSQVAGQADAHLHSGAEEPPTVRPDQTPAQVRGSLPPHSGRAGVLQGGARILQVSLGVVQTSKISMGDASQAKIITSMSSLSALTVLSNNLARLVISSDTQVIFKGTVVLHTVYRDCVHQLHSKDTWLKEARTVRIGEEPFKVRLFFTPAFPVPSLRKTSFLF